MEHLFVLSGCSGGGKSTLLAALSARGFRTMPEPGRRVLRAGGPAPWEDLPGFLRACLALSVEGHAQALAMTGPVIFDRSAVDALSGLAALGERVPDPGLRYAGTVFLAPPWPELFERDAERRHGFDAALSEYGRLLGAFPAAGYEIDILPKGTVAARVAWIEARIEAHINARIGRPGGT